MGMRGRHISPETRAAIARRAAADARAGRLDWRAIGRAFAVDKDTARKWGLEAAAAASTRPRAGGRPGAAPAVAAPGDAEAVEAGDVAEVRFVTDKLLRTDAEVTEAAGYDPATWAVAQKRFKTWTVTMKVKAGRGREVCVQKQNYGWTITLKRIMSKAREDAFRLVLDRMAARAPKFPPPARRRPPKAPHCLELDLFDVHFGKLAWRAESLADYDLKIAERIYREAVVDLFDQAIRYDFDEAILPIGNDFLHVDGPDNATTGGTPVDADGRYPKVLAAGQMALVWAVEELLKRVDRVRVLGVAGNHDGTSTLHNARFLWAYFRHARNVTVDCEPREWKYARYGCSLIGFYHGHDLKPHQMPTQLMLEAKELYAATSYQEIHCGHFHKAKQYATVAVDTHDAIVVRYLQSLSARDRWHYQQGFWGGRRAAEAFAWSREDALVGNFFAPVRRVAD